MKKFLTGFIVSCWCMIASAQYGVTFTIRSGESNTPLAGATVIWQEKALSFVADSLGHVAIQNIEAGKQTFIFSFVGLRARTVAYNFPLQEGGPILITLESDEEEHEEDPRCHRAQSRTAGRASHRA